MPVIRHGWPRAELRETFGAGCVREAFAVDAGRGLWWAGLADAGMERAMRTAAKPNFTGT
jgi:hypothetical protein